MFVKLVNVVTFLTKIIKLNIDLFSSFICQHFNYCISTSEFPNELKHADVIPAHTKKNKCDKTNYRPVSITFKHFKNL